MGEQVAQLLNEKCKVLETLSKCQQEVGINVDIDS